MTKRGPSARPGWARTVLDFSPPYSRTTSSGIQRALCQYILYYLNVCCQTQLVLIMYSLTELEGIMAGIAKASRVCVKWVCSHFRLYYVKLLVGRKHALVQRNDIGVQ